MTPGAAVVAYSDELHEQMDWIAEEVTDQGGDAWVLPLARLTKAEEARLAQLGAGRLAGARR